jgi:CRISPR/Cas system-associated exonuclease Cas4 (RecB family)
MLSIQSSTSMGTIPTVLEFLTDGSPLLSCCRALDDFILVHLSDGTTDLRHEQADGVAGYSVVILKGGILVTSSKVSQSDCQL